MGHMAFLAGLAEATDTHFRRPEVADAAPALQVMAGGKMRTVGADDHHPNLVVLHGRVQRRVDLVEHLRVLRISALFPRQHDARHVVGGPLVADRLERLLNGTHDFLPLNLQKPSRISGPGFVCSSALPCASRRSDCRL